MPVNNLWGDLSDLQSIRTPKSILEEQANYLTNALGGTLACNVYSIAGESRELIYDLDLIAPSLNNYSYTVLNIRHDVQMYPVTIFASTPEITYTCESEEEYIADLAVILSAKELRNVLVSLKSQIE